MCRVCSGALWILQSIAIFYEPAHEITVVGLSCNEGSDELGKMRMLVHKYIFCLQIHFLVHKYIFSPRIYFLVHKYIF